MKIPHNSARTSLFSFLTVWVLIIVGPLMVGSVYPKAYGKKRPVLKKKSRTIARPVELTGREILQVYRMAVKKKYLVPTYDPFLDLLGVLALAYSKDKRELIVTKKTIKKIIGKIEKKTLFNQFLNGFHSIHLTGNQEIITRMTRRTIRFDIPKAFGAAMDIASGFKLHVSRAKGNKTIVKVITPKQIHFRLQQSLFSKIKGVRDMDIRQLTLFPKKNKRGKEELWAWIDGEIPLWPLGNATRRRKARYKKYRVQVNLTLFGTVKGAASVKGYYL